MSPATIRFFEYENEAKAYAKELEAEYGKERILIFHEPERCPEKPYTVNID